MVATTLDNRDGRYSLDISKMPLRKLQMLSHSFSAVLNVFRTKSINFLDAV